MSSNSVFHHGRFGIFRRIFLHLSGMGICVCLLVSASPLPSPSVSVSPSPLASPSPGLSPAASKELLQEFQKSLELEMQALKQQNQMETKELDASLRARYKEWFAREADERHKRFSENTDLKREEKMAYIADYRNREKIFLQVQKTEKTQRLHAQEIHMGSVKADQAARLKEFKEFLARGERPPEWLWSSP